LPNPSQETFPVLLAEQSVLRGELKVTPSYSFKSGCSPEEKKVALTLITIIALAFVAVNFSNQQKRLPYTANALSPTLEPTPIATLTPPEPTVSFTLWHTIHLLFSRQQMNLNIYLQSVK